MRKLLLGLAILAAACGGEKQPPPPPTVTEVVPTPVPCVDTGGVGKDGRIFHGDCAITPECRPLGGGDFVGVCETL